MSETNPFSAPRTTAFPSNDAGPRKVCIEPIDLYKRSFALIGDQYWLFLGIAVVGVILGSIVPFGVLLGPMMVGIYLCFIDRERGKPVEFGTLFKGFDYFANSFIAVLIMIGVSLLVMIPLMIIMSVAMIFVMPSNGGGQASPLALLVVLFSYLVLLIAVFLVQLPFLFTFQLIAERGLTGPQAIGLSIKGVQKNLVGCVILALVAGLLSILASMACILPAFFLMPITLGVLFLAYRDIFGTSVS